MQRNEYGAELDQNGYSMSIMMRPLGSEHCALCGRRWGVKLDRHEPWGGANRQKSKRLGLWVYLCHTGCHEGPGSVHDDAELAREFRKDAQRAAMLRYGWNREEFIRQFGKNELSDEEAAHIIPKDAGREYVLGCRAEHKTVGQSAGGFRVLHEAALLPF